MSRALRAVLLACLLPALLAAGLAPVRAAADGSWAFVSAYSWERDAGNGGTYTTTRASYRVPAGEDLEVYVDGRPMGSYSGSGNDGTLNVVAFAVPADVEFRTPSGTVLWTHRLAESQPGLTAVLEFDTVTPARVPVGGTVVVAGSLVGPRGEPLPEGTDVMVLDLRQKKPECTDGCMTTGRGWADAVVGADGRWSTRAQAVWNVPTPEASFCSDCWDSPWDWARTRGPALEVHWRPTLVPPREALAGERSSYTVRLSKLRAAAWSGVAVELQRLRGGSWTTVASGQTGAGGRAVLSATLPRGEHRLRVAAAAATQHRRGDQKWLMRSIEGGASRVVTVRVDGA